MRRGWVGWVGCWGGGAGKWGDVFGFFLSSPFQEKPPRPSVIFFFSLSLCLSERRNTERYIKVSILGHYFYLRWRFVDHFLHFGCLAYYTWLDYSLVKEYYVMKFSKLIESNRTKTNQHHYVSVAKGIQKRSAKLPNKYEVLSVLYSNSFRVIARNNQ
jgi:hypothetical protein